MCFRVVAAVGKQQTRPLSWPSDGAADRRDRLNEREQLGDVMCVGACEQAGKRCAVGVGDQVVLAAEFAPINGAVLLPLKTSWSEE